MNHLLLLYIVNTCQYSLYSEVMVIPPWESHSCFNPYRKKSLLQLRGLEGNHSPYQPAFQLVFHIEITLGSRSAYLEALLSFSTRTPSCSRTWNSSSKGLSSQWLKNWTPSPPSPSHVDLTFPPAQPLFSHHQHDVSPCFTIIWLFHHYETIN